MVLPLHHLDIVEKIMSGIPHDGQI